MLGLNRLGEVRSKWSERVAPQLRAARKVGDRGDGGRSLCLASSSGWCHPSVCHQRRRAWRLVELLT